MKVSQIYSQARAISALIENLLCSSSLLPELGNNKLLLSRQVVFAQPLHIPQEFPVNLQHNKKYDHFVS